MSSHFVCVHNYIDSVLLCPHPITVLVNSDYFDSLGSSESVGEEHYIDFKVTLPWVAKKYERSFICYNPNGQWNGKRVRMTHVYFYRPDGKVQSFSHVGYRPPFPGAICITYNGINHYDALEIKARCPLSGAPHFRGSSP